MFEILNYYLRCLMFVNKVTDNKLTQIHFKILTDPDV